MDLAIDLFLGGAGANIPALVGAVARLERASIFPIRVAGSSAGFICAGGLASGLSAGELNDKVTYFLGRGGLLDKQLNILNGFGVHKGQALRDAIHDVVPGTLGDLKLYCGAFAWDNEVRDAVFIDSKTYPNALVADVAAASSAIPGVFAGRVIPGVPGFFTDGGLTHNNAFDVFDDVPSRLTVGIRIKPSVRRPRQKVDGALDALAGFASGLSMAVSQTHVPNKRYWQTIDIDINTDGLAFKQTHSETLQRYTVGFQAADAWLTKNHAQIERWRRGDGVDPAP